MRRLGGDLPRGVVPPSEKCASDGRAPGGDVAKAGFGGSPSQKRAADHIRKPLRVVADEREALEKPLSHLQQSQEGVQGLLRQSNCGVEVARFDKNCAK